DHRDLASVPTRRSSDLHAKMMLQRDFGSVFYLLWRPAHDGTKSSRRHGGCGAHLALAANLRARDRGAMLDDAADGCCGQKEVADRRVTGTGIEFDGVA